MDPSEIRHSLWAYGLLVFYLAQGVGTMLLLRRRQQSTESFRLLVHIADMAVATVAAIGRWPSRQALIVADDQPAPWRDVLTYVCTVAGSSPPQAGGRALMPSFRVTNRRARELLSWAPLYADYRAGLVR